MKSLTIVNIILDSPGSPRHSPGFPAGLCYRGAIPRMRDGNDRILETSVPNILRCSNIFKR